ncbi:AMP-binding protein [Actinospongicola halichondriae]|uniref:AMP-binding protein n=1 Tax=Actinospongicola halichondriae TaxID=3236844 RepID=UPI003D4A0A87
MPGHITVQTLQERIAAGAALGHEVTFVSGDVHVTVPWQEVHDDARTMAAGLQELGIVPGAHVAILGPTSRALVTAIQSVWLAGATVVVLPLPMRMGSLDEFVAQTRQRIHHGDIDLVLADAELAAFITPEPGDPELVVFDDVPSGSVFVEPAADPQTSAILQFTSGSTSDPKGVVLPHRAVCANLDAIATAAELDVERDVLVSWLPLYHDMGLVGLLTLAMTTGSRFVLGAPQDFLASPARWMQWMSRYGGTATAGPNFSYVLASRALRRAAKEGEDLDLSSLRVVLNGAEPIDPATVADFVDAAGRFGMEPGAVFPAFGMAEVAIAGTFPPPGRGIVVDTVDRRVLETERYAAPVETGTDGSRGFARLGRAVPGLEIRIVDPATGRPRLEREVGEVEIRGTSVCSGYYGRDELNADLFHDGWLRTGDLGYLVDEELVLCGRIKDVIIVGGRNVFPEDIERACNLVEGVRAGNVIAFGIETTKGKEGLVVVAESKAADLEPVRRSVTERVRETVGVPAKDVVLVAPGTLPKTSSGKLQRTLCRDQYLGRALQFV